MFLSFEEGSVSLFRVTIKIDQNALCDQGPGLCGQSLFGVEEREVEQLSLFLNGISAGVAGDEPRGTSGEAPVIHVWGTDARASHLSPSHPRTDFAFPLGARASPLIFRPVLLQYRVPRGHNCDRGPQWRPRGNRGKRGQAPSGGPYQGFGALRGSEPVPFFHSPFDHTKPYPTKQYITELRTWTSNNLCGI